MIVSVKLFARIRDLAGTGCVELVVPEPCHVADLKHALAERFPPMRPWLPTLLVAVDGAYALADAPVPPHAEIACFPPVSGG